VKRDGGESVREYYRRQGEKREQERIIELLQRLPFIWAGTTQMIQTSRNELINLIEGKTNE